MDDSELNLDSASSEVEHSCKNHIKTIFQTLLLERNLIQQEVANSLSVDKAYISRIFNGIEIPCLDMRLKIAKFFGVDSCLIWRLKDIDVIRELLIKQKEEKNDN